MAYKYIVVDDEPLARKLVIGLTKNIEGLYFCGDFGNAIEAGNFLRQNPIDLIFLDINMPKLDGLKFIETLPKHPLVILTTAHRDYAPEAFSAGAVDYLLKPIALERLLKAVNRFFERVENRNVRVGAVMQPLSIYIKADRRMHKVSPEQLIYIESLDEYVKIILRDKVLISRENISSLAARLPEDRFIRIHRSFIISKTHIASVASDGIEIHGKVLPFGRAFKLSALAALGISGKVK